MPPTVLRRTDGDLTRKYWWVLLLLVLCVGGGALVSMRQTHAPGPSVDPATGEAADQSLESINQGLATIGAPGGPLNLSMDGSSSGSYRRRSESEAQSMKSSLYEAPTGAVKEGAPAVAQSGSAASSGEGGSLADALKKVAASKPSKADNKGWGNAAVRTGFTPPKAGFGGLSGLSGGGGGGGSGASFSVGGTGNNSAFGIAGSNPGSVGTMGLGGAGGGAAKIRKGGHNQAFDMLKKVETVAGKSAAAGSGDQAANLNQRGFDGGTARSSTIGGTGGAATGGSVVNSSIPENLKLDDPKLNQKKIEVPAIGQDKPVGNPNMMEQQIMMMVITMAIGGILGPVFGGMGTMLANGLLGTNMTYQPTGHNYVDPNTGRPR